MTLEPQWFSTMFGVYYFASCVLAVNSSLTLTLMWLQSKGRLASSVTVHHFHDLGKMVFAFTIFWAYIGFSQFMLQWYAHIPEETLWWKERFCGRLGQLFLVPAVRPLRDPVLRPLVTLGEAKPKSARFLVHLAAGHDLRRHVLLVMPSLGTDEVPFQLIDLTCWIGVLSLFIAGVAYRAKNLDLLAKNDPRLPDSLAFENI